MADSEEGASSDVSQEISKKFYDPLDNLSPKQQKFVIMQVTTTMSPSEVAKVIGISDYKRRKWSKDDDVQAYKKQCQKKYDDSEIIEAARRQTNYIREQMFKELTSRFEDPDKAWKAYKKKAESEGREVSVQEEIDFKERFAHNASFKDLMKVWKDVDKSFRLDSDKPTERVDDQALEIKAKRRFTKMKNREEKMKALEKKAEEGAVKGLTFEEFQQQLKESDEEVETVEAEFENKFDEDDSNGLEEIEILEEFEITKRG